MYFNSNTYYLQCKLITTYLRMYECNIVERGAYKAPAPAFSL